MQRNQSDQERLEELVQRNEYLRVTRQRLEAVLAHIQNYLNQANAQLDEKRLEFQRVRGKIEEINKTWDQVRDRFETQSLPDDIPEEVLMALKERRRLDLIDPTNERRCILRSIFRARQEIKVTTQQIDSFEHKIAAMKVEQEQVLSEIFRLI